jgi:diketogulonate reductase-like aldo/keto reductase
MLIRLRRSLISVASVLLTTSKRSSLAFMSTTTTNARPLKRTLAAMASDSNVPFRNVSSKDAKFLTDGVQLANSSVILPWIGYGTYKLGKENAKECTLEALRRGYRCIDTAFIYGGETTEKNVGLALQDAFAEKIVTRESIVIITKHWRAYHGYEPTMECLRKSLKRLQVDSIDLWLIHWPGPAYNTMNRRKDVIAEQGPWAYAHTNEKEMPVLRSETWRAMEDAVKSGKVKAIGVSNFSVNHLKRLKETATIWPPAVNQIEYHPTYLQKELVQYCQKEGIVIQAYASLGGQDTGKKFWQKIYPGKQKHPVSKLWNTPPVMELAEKVNKTPAQVLLRWALEHGAAIVPKTATPERMTENADILDFSLSAQQVQSLEERLNRDMSAMADADQEEDPSLMGRLCWKNDPLRMLTFD